MLFSSDTVLRLVRPDPDLIPILRPHQLNSVRPGRVQNSHLTVRGMFMWCAACGHGAHAACIAILAHGGGTDSGPSSFTGASPNVDVSHSHSHPSTPGIGTPMRNWMWGEGEDGEEGNDSFGAQSRSGTDRSQSKRPLSNGCPAGLCGHSPCLLNSAYE